MKFRIVLIFLLLPIFLNAQKFMVFDVDSSQLPIISANYLLFDAEDKLVEDVLLSDFKVELGAGELEIVHLKSPKRSKKVHKISIVLTIDVSGSMGGENIELAKQAAITFIQMTPLFSCEIAVTTFDDGNYINMDFTKNKEKLYKSVGKIQAWGGTNYDEGLLKGPAGALDVLNDAQYDKKIVIFLTDGLGTGSRNKIVLSARNQDAKIYPITVNMPMPQVLSDIAEGTDAEYFENISNTTDAENAYIKILSEMMNTEFGEISWRIEPICDVKNTNMILSYTDFQFLLPFNFPPKMLISLIPNNDLIDFGNVAVGDTAYNKIRYTATNENFEVLEIKSKNPEIFEIIPPNSVPFTIPKGKSVEFIVKYMPTDSLFITDRITFVTDKCSARPVLLYGGIPSKDPYNSNLEIIYPNGGEKLGIASFSKTTWAGVSVFDSVSVSLSVDSGKTYKNLGIGGNLEFPYVVPGKKSDFCLMRISHKMLSYMQYEISLSMSAKQALFMKDDKTIFVSGSNFVGLMNIQHGNFNSIYTPRKQMNIVKLNPDETQFFDINREQITVRNISDFKATQEIKPFKILGITFKKIHKKAIVDACYSSDGQQIVSISRDGEMKSWDVLTGKNIISTKTDIKNIEKIEIAPDTSLLTIIALKNLYIYDLNTLELVKEFEENKNIVDVYFYENSNKLMIIQKYGIIKCYETNTWTDIFEQSMSYDKLLNIELDPTEERIAVLHNKGTSIFTFPDFEHQFDIKYDRRINSTNFSNDGMRIITTAGRKLPIWSAYKRVEQIDISDDFFTIEGGLPDVIPVVIPPSFVSYNTSEYVVGFLSNPNGYEIEIQEIKFVGADATKFGLVSGFPPFKIGAFSGKNVEFSYNSNEEGIDQAEILIITYADTIRTTISGEAKPVPFRLTSSYIDFGTIKKDEKKRKNVPVMTNISDSPLKIVEVFEVGGEDGQFELNYPLKGRIIQPGKKLFIDATYIATIPRRSTMAYKLFFEGVQQAITISMKGNCYVPKFVVLSGVVTDMLTTKPISATITVHDILAEVSTGAVKSNINGDYKIRLSMDRKLKIIASAPGYTSQETIIDLTVFTSIGEMTKDFQLEPDFSQMNVVVMNLLFDTDEYFLKSDEKNKMNGLITFLKKRKDLKIEICGHTDDEGDDAHNLRLSKNRANSVKNYLVSRGISSSRITTQGFGATQPVSTNDSDEGRQENRRVELRFVD